MTEAQELPVVEQLGNLSLVPVGLKEAALDSPTFRATAVHFSDQIDLVERWLGDYIKAATRLLNDAYRKFLKVFGVETQIESGGLTLHLIQALEELVNGVVGRAIPPSTLSESVLDPDYTLLVMQRANEGAREFWSYAISCMKKMEAIVVEPLRAFMQGELRNFKDARQHLFQSQKSFDNILSRFAAQSKTKEPSALREDAFQLYEARKIYLKASMEFCILAPQLRSLMDKLLVRVFSDQWSDMKVSGENAAVFFGKWGAEVERVRNWSTELEAGEKSFKRELQSARKSLEERSMLAFRPSRELDDYAIPTVSNLGSRGPSMVNLQSPDASGSDKTEKHGWLFLRMLTGKPTRTNWVRRWFFVKQGIFGWLAQSIRNGGVEESERIGVLLCSVRLAIQEDKRFCFEVKTKDNTILLQAETSAELGDWLQVFDRAKKAALDGTDRGTSYAGLSQHDAAFAITPPSAPEFALNSSESHAYHGGEDLTGLPIDRSAALPVLDRDVRSSFDVGSRRSTTGEKDGEGMRDSASRIIQKLDLHRKSAAGSLLTAASSGAPLSAGLSAPWGANASLNTANYNASFGHRASVFSANLLTPSTSSVSTELTAANIAAVNIAQQDGVLPPSTLAPLTLANPPAPTNLSKTAVIVSGERNFNSSLSDTESGIPNGVMANFWGTISLPIVNRLERRDVRPELARAHIPTLRDELFPNSGQHRQLGTTTHSFPSQDSNPAATGGSAERAKPAPTLSRASGHRNTVSLDAHAPGYQQPTHLADEFPSNYPIQLKMQDAQFRILFPDTRSRDRVLLVFRAAWNPNEQQDFPGRIYVTENDIHFYSHHLGLVLTSSISLGSIDEVTVAPGKAFDLLFLHLKEGSSESGYTRVTIKVFLESPRLLQRRLNFLVRNFHHQKFFHIEAVLDELLVMEKNDAQDAPSLESWEDVSIRTPNDDELSPGKADTPRRQRDLRATLDIDHDLQGDRGVIHRKIEASRFKLPAEPILYVPEDKGHISVEQQYDISAKALFHLMFGDKSTVFQMLYHERRAKHILQTPWLHLDKGHLQRDFEYQTGVVNIFGASRSVKVVDHQRIEVLNDHLCYVVTDTKTPWHLPHWTDFMLVSTIVITHLTKSKCKLVIYTSVEWSKTPILSKSLVEKEALDDLRQDAFRLADVITDQVSRLGPQTRTKKAIDIFGHVGQDPEALAISNSAAARETYPGAVSIRQRSLVHIIGETLGSIAESVISSLMMWAFAMLRRLWKVSSAHGLLLSVLAASLLVNLLYTSRQTVTWLNERHTGNFMARLGVGPDTILSRSVTLEAIDSFGGRQVDVPGGRQDECFTMFHSLVSLAEHPAHTRATEVSSFTPLTQATSHRLRRTRERLGSYRHDLLVAMRVVNAVEQEMLMAEWENWIVDEMIKCDQVERLIRPNLTRATGAGDTNKTAVNRDMEVLRRWHEDYCGSCRKEYQQLEPGRQNRFVSA